MRHIDFTPVAEAQFNEWAVTDKKIYNKIIDLLEAVRLEPFTGIRKPEPLKYQFKGYWSRRINKAHRLVYKVTDESVIVISCMFHY